MEYTLTDDRDAPKSSTESALDINAVSKTFGRKGGATRALEDVNLTVGKGEFVCLLGPSGCGKSTLLNIIAGFTSPDAGSVRANGRDVSGPGADRCMLFQSPTLFPWLTTVENVLFGPRAQHRMSEAIRERGMALLETVGLSGFEHHYPHQLSGGMRYRVAFARALINEPAMLLLDEPFAALDAITRASMQQFLLDIWGLTQPSILFVTHDVEEATLLGNRVCVMSARPGRIAHIVDITLPRKRDYSITETVEFVEARRSLRRMLEEAMS